MRLIVPRFALAVLVSAVASVRLARADAGDDQYASAASEYAAQHWQAACDQFAELLTAHPDHARAGATRFYYGEALAQLGQHAEARTQFSELLKREPQHRFARQALFRSGETAYFCGDDVAARRDLEAFLVQHPKDELLAYALPYLAQIELSQGQPGSARAQFAKALEQFEDGPLAEECRLGLARCAEESHELPEASRGYRQVIDAHSRLADQALMHLGSLENASGDYEAALKNFEQLAAEFPDSSVLAKAQLARGYALHKLGRDAEAESVLEPLVSHPQLQVDAHYWLGLSQIARKQWNEAARTLTEGGRLDEKHRLSPAMGLHAAQAMLKDGRNQQACDEFSRVLELWPRSDVADACALGRIQVYGRQNEHAECVRMADEFSKEYPLSPLRVQAELAKGQAQFALRKYSEAAATLASCMNHKGTADAVWTDESQTAARSTLALCYAKLGRLDDATRSLGNMSEEKPSESSGVARYQVAESALAAGNLQLATELFTDLARRQTDPTLASKCLSGLGWCQFKAKNWTEAAETFERLQKEFSDSPLAAEAALMCGQSLEQLDQADAALAMYDVVFKKYPTSDRMAEALWYAARLHEQREQPSDACRYYEQLVHGHPDFPEFDAVLYRWALLLEHSKKTEASTALLERLRRDLPQSRFAPDAALRLAEHSLAGQDYEQTDKLLTELTADTAPELVRERALYLQGRLAMAQQHWPEVEASLAQLIETFPNGELLLPASYLIAEALYRQGKYEKAAERFADLSKMPASREQSWSATAELRQAQAWAQLKEWEKSFEVARGITTHFPDFSEQYEVNYLIGRTLAAQADFAAARESYTKVIESPAGGKTQTAAMARWMIGESFFHQENYAAALAEYLQVAECSFPRWQAAGLLQAGKCHEALGQWSQAAEVYERLSNKFPMSELSDEAKQRAAAARQQIAAGTKSLK